MPKKTAQNVADELDHGETSIEDLVGEEFIFLVESIEDGPVREALRDVYEAMVRVYELLPAPQPKPPSPLSLDQAEIAQLRDENLKLTAQVQSLMAKVLSATAKETR